MAQSIDITTIIQKYLLFIYLSLLCGHCEECSDEAIPCHSV